MPLLILQLQPPLPLPLPLLLLPPLEQAVWSDVVCLINYLQDLSDSIVLHYTAR